MCRQVLTAAMLTAVMAIMVGCSEMPATQAAEPAGGVPVAGTHPELAGVWEPVIHEDAEDRIPGPEKGDYMGLPLTEAARKLADAWDPAVQYEDENQCLSHTAIYMMRSPFRFEIVHSNNLLMLVSESYEQVRSIYLDGRKHHPKESPHTRMGHSIGWWEGDALVVETTNMQEGYLKRNGVPHSPDAVLTEYFTRQSGRNFGDLMTIVQIVEDPVYLTQPLIRSVTFRKVPDGKLEPYPCTVLDL